MRKNVCEEAKRAKAKKNRKIKTGGGKPLWRRCSTVGRSSCRWEGEWGSKSIGSHYGDRRPGRRGVPGRAPPSDGRRTRTGALIGGVASVRRRPGGLRPVRPAPPLHPSDTRPSTTPPPVRPARDTSVYVRACACARAGGRAPRNGNGGGSLPRTALPGRMIYRRERAAHTRIRSSAHAYAHRARTRTDTRSPRSSSIVAHAIRSFVRRRLCVRAENIRRRP